MATHTVKQSGGDFSTLATALADAGTGAGDTISIEGAWTIDDTDECTVADDNITIQTDASSKHLGYPYNGSGTWYRLHTTGTGHSITINNTGLSADGLDIQNTSTGESDEVFRLASTNPTIKNCVLGFASRNSQQDIIYKDTDTAATISFENCMFYNVYRAAIDFYQVLANCTININSCTAYDIGFSAVDTDRSGLFAMAWCTASYTFEVNIFNTVVHINAGFVTSSDAAPTFNVTIDRATTNVPAASWSQNADSETVTDSLVSHNFTDDNSKSSDGDWVIVEDITTSPYDLRLQSNTYNEVQDMHADSSGAGLSMPSTDLVGTSRPQNTNYDCGAFEVASASSVTVALAPQVVGATLPPPTVVGVGVTCQVATLTAVTSAHDPTVTYGTTYYVSASDGSNSYNGLYPSFQGGSDGPWLTFAYAENNISPGDTVIGRGGNYEEYVFIEVANTTWEAYPGETPVIDGDVDEGGYPFDLPPWGGMGLFCVRGDADHVTIDGFKFINSYAYGVSGFPMGHAEGDSEYLTIKNCTTYDTRALGIMAASDNSVVDNCNVAHFSCKFPEEGGTWSGGISTGTGDNVTVKNCLVHEGWGEGITLSEGSNCIAEDNIVYDARSCGIYIIRANNPICRRNIVYGTRNTTYHRFDDVVGIGIAIASEHLASGSGYGAKVYNNLVADCYGSFCIAIWDQGGGDALPTHDVEVYENTFVESYVGTNNDTAFQISGSGHDSITVRNNIIVNTVGNLDSIAAGNTNLTFSNNLWWDGAGGSPSDAASGPGDVLQNPQLIKSSNWNDMTAGGHDAGDWQVQPSSPAKEAGYTIGSPYNVDYTGVSRPQDAAYDIGAYELVVASLEELSVLTAANPVTVAVGDVAVQLSNLLVGLGAETPSLLYDYVTQPSTVELGSLAHLPFAVVGNAVVQPVALVLAASVLADTVIMVGDAVVPLDELSALTFANPVTVGVQGVVIYLDCLIVTHTVQTPTYIYILGFTKNVQVSGTSWTEGASSTTSWTEDPSMSTNWPPDGTMKTDDWDQGFGYDPFGYGPFGGVIGF